MPLRRAWTLIRGTLEGYIADDAFSRGASIAYFTLFSLAPVLLVIIAVAGMVFGQDAAQGAIVDQLSGLMGRDTAGALQAMLRSASDRFSGTLATLIGLATVLLAATGVFGEVQMALNAIWRAKSRRSTLSRLVRTRIASLGLVIALGFVLMVSLVFLLAQRTERQEPKLLWRGRAIGGNSSINGQIAIRGVPDDFDDWVAAGCAGWGWQDVLPYFCRQPPNGRGRRHGTRPHRRVGLPGVQRRQRPHHDARSGDRSQRRRAHAVRRQRLKQTRR